jgi:peptide/nickel transport system ATP-binding protein
MLLNPEFLIADEPVSMLDVSVRADIINMLTDLARKHESAMVFISHDIATTRYISDRVAVMYLGRIVEIGDTDTVLHDPKHPYTQALISNSPDIDPRVKKEAITLEGEPPTPINTGPGCYFAPRCRYATEKCKAGYPDMKTVGEKREVACFLYEDIEN